MKKFDLKKYEVDEKGNYKNPNTAREIYGDRLDPKGFMINFKDPNKVADIESFKDEWIDQGANPDKKLSFHDRVMGKVNNKPYYYEHKPTWKDRAKEVGQGLAGFVGGMADMGESIGLAPNVAKWLGKESKHQDYRTLAKNHPSLRTRNIDTPSYMLRGAGEFLPEILPMAGLGKLAKGTSNILGKAAKKHKISTGYTGKIGNKLVDFMETPLTAKNAAGFAGAGAAHGYLHTPGQSGKERDVPWYQELPVDIMGALGASGLYGAGKGTVKGIRNYIKGNRPVKHGDFDLIDQHYLRKIVKKNKKAGNELDHKFVYNKDDHKVPLNAFNIYKDPAKNEAYNLANVYRNRKYENYLDNMKGKIEENVEKILDEQVIPHDKTINPHRLSDELAADLNKIYRHRRDKTRGNFEFAHTKIDNADMVIPKNTINELKTLDNLTKDSFIKGSTGRENLNNYVRNALVMLDPNKGYPIRGMVNARQDINELIQKLPTAPDSLGKVRYKTKGIKKGIDLDIDDAITSGLIKNKDFFKTYNKAKDYHKDIYGPYSKDPLLKKLYEGFDSNPNGYANDILQDSFKTRGDTIQLEKLISKGISDMPSNLKSKSLINPTLKLKRAKMQNDIVENQKEFLNNNNNNKSLSTKKLLDYIKNNKHDPIFDSELDEIIRAKHRKIPERLDKETTPLIEKYLGMKKIHGEKAIDKDNKLPLVAAIIPDYMMGSGVGAFSHKTVPAALTAGAAAIVPRMIGRGVSNKISNKLHDNFFDEKFVKQLIENTRKAQRIYPPDLSHKNTWKKQGLLAPLRKNEGEKWGE